MNEVNQKPILYQSWIELMKTSPYMDFLLKAGLTAFLRPVTFSYSIKNEAGFCVQYVASNFP